MGGAGGTLLCQAWPITIPLMLLLAAIAVTALLVVLWNWRKSNRMSAVT
jgi:hypothetical protein